MTQENITYKTFSIRTSLKTAYQLTKDNFAKLAFCQLILAGIFFAIQNLFMFVFPSAKIEYVDNLLIELVYFSNLCLALKLLDKQEIGVSNLFNRWKKVLPFFAGLIIYSVFFIAGIFCLIIPGIFIVIRWGFFPCFILDKNSGVFESLKQSWKLTKGVFWKSLGSCTLFMLVIELFYSISPYALLTITPFLFLASVSIYRQLMASEEATQKDVPIELIPAAG